MDAAGVGPADSNQARNVTATTSDDDFTTGLHQRNELVKVGRYFRHVNGLHDRLDYSARSG